MNNREFRRWLVRHEACQPARRWVGKQHPREAWSRCQRGDWLVWLLWRLHYPFTILSPLVRQMVERADPAGDAGISQSAARYLDRADDGYSLCRAANAAALSYANQHGDLWYETKRSRAERAWQADLVRATIPWQDVCVALGYSHQAFP